MPHAANRLQTPSANASADQLGAALSVLAKLLVPFIAVEMGVRPANDVDDWIDQRCSPLGRRLHCALARSGQLHARKVGRRWMVRRADVNAFIAEHGNHPAPAPPQVDEPSQEDRVRALLAEYGADLSRPTPVRRRKARGR